MLKIPLIRDVYVEDVREMINNVLEHEDVNAMYGNVLMKKKVRESVLVPEEIVHQVLLTDWADKVEAIANAMYDEDMFVVSDTVHDLHF